MHKAVSRWVRLCLLVHLCLNRAWSEQPKESTVTKHEVPQSCRERDLKVLGEPTFLSPDSEVSLGLSVPQRRFPVGGDLVLHVWALNRSAKTWYVWTCMDLDFFKGRAFDIYDATGHRVFSHAEVKVREHCKSDPVAANLEWTMKICSRNFTIPIAAGTCVTGEDYDFALHLKALYDLPLGEYVIHLRPEEARLRDICAAPPEPVFVPGPDDLHLTVVEPLSVPQN